MFHIDTAYFGSTSVGQIILKKKKLFFLYKIFFFIVALGINPLYSIPKKKNNNFSYKVNNKHKLFILNKTRSGRTTNYILVIIYVHI